jgi:5-methylcytosine-specific restriction endonuclease McrA
MRRRRARKLSQLGDWILPESEFIALLFETYPYCYYCEEPLISGFHVDHKIPLSRPELLQAGRKGLHEPWNLRLSCPGCNMSKGNRTAEEFRQTHGTAS